MKENIQQLAEELSILCLENSQYYCNYSDEDLFNATEIFMHVLMDKLYSKNMDMPLGELEVLAEKAGSSLRKLILVNTGKDMHKVVEKLIKE